MAMVKIQRANGVIPEKSKLTDPKPGPVLDIQVAIAENALVGSKPVPMRIIQNNKKIAK